MGSQPVAVQHFMLWSSPLDKGLTVSLVNTILLSKAYGRRHERRRPGHTGAFILQLSGVPVGTRKQTPVIMR